MTPPLLRTDVRDVLILHWSVPPDVVQALLPAGVEPDLVDGHAWIGLLALCNVVQQPLGLPVPRRLSSYPQVNVRGYGRHPSGRTGVVFTSMEAGGAAAAWAGRLGIGLPYRWRGIPVSRHGDLLSYGSRVTARIGPPIAAHPVVETLLEHAGGLFLRRAGRLLWIADEHPPWPLFAADVLSVGPPAGSPVPDRPPDNAVYSPGVPMVLQPPVRLD